MPDLGKHSKPDNCGYEITLIFMTVAYKLYRLFY